MEKIGFIGLGIMGAPMAGNLLKHGVDLCVYDTNALAVERLAKAGAKSGTPAEIGGDCDIIFTILPNGDVVKDVLFGENGMAEVMREGSLVVDMSSVQPAESTYCAEALAKKRIGFVDAPVSGGEPKAIDGTLAFMAGGGEEDYAKAKPYFDMMGASSILVGKSGSGSLAKLANQVIVNLTIAAVSEAFVLAGKAGADPEKVYQAIRGGLAGSAVLDAKVPMMLRRDFKPGGKLSINLKDIKNAMAAAHDTDVPMPFTSQLLEVVQALKVDGHIEDDHGGIIQYFEKLAGFEVGG